MKKLFIICCSAVVFVSLVFANDVNKPNHNGYAVKPVKKPIPVKPSTYIMSDIDCLAINSYKEANTTTERDRLLVNSVVENRELAMNKTACEVISQKYQFSWTNNIKFKTKFKTKQDMFNYYGVTEDSYNKQLPMVNEAIIQHSVVAYKKTNPSESSPQKLSNNAPTFYHDNSIKRFRFNTSNMFVIIKTKYFVFYGVKRKKKVSI